MTKCKAKTKAGDPCRAPAGADGLCFLHANPDKVQALGQAGGRKNRQQITEVVVLPPTSTKDLTEILSQAICDLLSGRISPHTASAIAQLCNTIHRIMPGQEFEKRLQSLEQQIAERGLGAEVCTERSHLIHNDNEVRTAEAETTLPPEFRASLGEVTDRESNQVVDEAGPSTLDNPQEPEGEQSAPPETGSGLQVDAISGDETDGPVHSSEPS